jgi:hypothetical protein
VPEHTAVRHRSGSVSSLQHSAAICASPQPFHWAVCRRRVLPVSSIRPEPCALLHGLLRLLLKLHLSPRPASTSRWTTPATKLVCGRTNITRCLLGSCFCKVAVREKEETLFAQQSKFVLCENVTPQSSPHSCGRHLYCTHELPEGILAPRTTS